jgi:hypothetical protein
MFCLSYLLIICFYIYGKFDWIANWNSLLSSSEVTAIIIRETGANIHTVDRIERCLVSLEHTLRYKMVPEYMGHSTRRFLTFWAYSSIISRLFAPNTLAKTTQRHGQRYRGNLSQNKRRCPVHLCNGRHTYIPTDVYKINDIIATYIYTLISVE